jgi:hypothetical protein
VAAISFCAAFPSSAATRDPYGRLIPFDAKSYTPGDSTISEDGRTLAFTRNTRLFVRTLGSKPIRVTGKTSGPFRLTSDGRTVTTFQELHKRNSLVRWSRSTKSIVTLSPDMDGNLVHSSNGHYVASVGERADLTLTDSATGVKSTIAPNSALPCDFTDWTPTVLAMDAAGDRLVYWACDTEDYDGYQLHVWDRSSGSRPLAIQVDRYGNLEITDDGRYVFFGDESDVEADVATYYRLDLETGQRAVIRPPVSKFLRARIAEYEFSGDGRWAVFTPEQYDGGLDRHLSARVYDTRLWDMRTGKVRVIFRARRDDSGIAIQAYPTGISSDGRAISMNGQGWDFTGAADKSQPILWRAP